MTAHGSAALPSLAALHAAGRQIVMLTAYDHPSARIAVAGGADVILVGDSAAMTVLGYGSTREITAEELLVLTCAARRGSPGVPLIGDLPFGSYEESDDEAVASARRFVDEAGCDAVKLEGAGAMVSRVRAIVAAGIPVVGHVGLLPQSVLTADGYRAKGRDEAQALAILRDAAELEAAGCAALVVEAVPAEVTALLMARASVPVVGIGAGPADGQVLVYHDLLGFTEGRTARFVKRYADGHADLTAAVARWAEEVRGGAYPAPEHTYPMDAATLARVKADPSLRSG